MNWDEADGADVCRDCWPRMITLDLKLVSVWFSGLGRALPTLNFGFCYGLEVVELFRIYVVKDERSEYLYLKVLFLFFLLL